MKHFTKLLFITLLSVLGYNTTRAEIKTLTFVQTSSSAGTLSGDVPSGVTATFSNTYSTKDQLTNGNRMTLTLSGWAETTTIKGVTLEVKNNKYSGNGTATVTIGQTTLGTLSITGLGNTYQEKALTITETQTTSNLVIYIECPSGKNNNSVYCDKFIVSYEEGGSSLTPSNLALTDAPVELSFDLYNNSSAQTVSYTTSSPGAVTVSGGARYVTASVNESTNTITVTPIAVTPEPQTITVSQAADATYAAGTATFTVTITDSNAPGTTQQNPYTVAQALTAIQALPNNNATSEKYYISGIVSAFYGDATGIMSASSKRYYISDDGTTTTQLLVYNGKGLNDVAFSSDDDLLIGDEVVIYGAIQNYQGNTPEITSGNYISSIVYNKKNPTIDVTSESVVYGSTFTIDDTKIVGGDITVMSSNLNVATVNELIINPVAVGKTTITINTASNFRYNAGCETFELTVTAPEGGTTAKTADDVVLFHETFGDNENSARAWSDDYSVKSGVNNVYENITSYTVSNVKQGKNTTGSTGSGLNQSSQGTDASIIIGPLNVANYEDMTLTYQWKAASVNGTYSTSAFYATSSTGDYKSLTLKEGTGVGATSFVECAYSLPEEAQVSTLYLKIVWNTSNTQAIIDEVNLSIPGAATEPATLNASGYATYCSQYPLDFSEAETNGYTAWQITAIASDGTITFGKITGAVKGGTGLLLKGTAGGTVTLSSADSNTTLSDNLLIGTLAPTYIETPGAVYGLSGSTFKKNSVAGTIGANKAYIDANDIPSEAKSFRFVFEDDATGITEIHEVSREDVEQIFNLNGQRLPHMQKGINIVNGKKVLIKQVTY